MRPYIDTVGRIVSDVIPEVVTLFKGEYRAEHLKILGGRMKYTDYMANETVKRNVEGRTDPGVEKEMKHKDVANVIDGGYIYAPGDQYIFFGKRTEENTFRQLYGYQGSFKVDSGSVANKALGSDEPLYTDIDTVFANSSQPRSVQNGIDKELFKQKLFELKG